MKKQLLFQIPLLLIIGVLLLNQGTNAFLEQPSKGYFSEQIQAGQRYRWEILQYKLPENHEKYNSTFLQGLEEGKILDLKVIKTPIDLNTQSNQIQVSEYFSASIDGNPFLLGKENLPAIWFVHYDSSTMTTTLSVPLISPVNYEF